jgi:uncharacterized membrane protein (UPF0127 family)
MRTYFIQVLVVWGFLATQCGGNRIETRDSGPTGAGTISTEDLTTNASEPRFLKEGNLAFLSAKGDTLTKIEIEVASTDAEREQGLMFRTSLPEMSGMIFLFDEPDYQSFWMKNTPSSLDILFISPQNTILNIHKYTSPYSMEGLPSSGPSDKVVEVKAGFCDKYKIEPGGKIAFKVDKKAS